MAFSPQLAHGIGGGLVERRMVSIDSRIERKGLTIRLNAMKLLHESETAVMLNIRGLWKCARTRYDSRSRVVCIGRCLMNNSIWWLRTKALSWYPACMMVGA